MTTTLSVIIPALNEAGNLEICVPKVIQALPPKLTYEILIFNDGSTDATGTIAETLAKQYPAVRVFHNQTNMGMGYNYTKGISLARGEFVTMVPGDNEVRCEMLTPALEQLGSADILILYTNNLHIRPLGRQILSKAFTFLFNITFGLKVKYFNGSCIHRTALLKSITGETSGPAYMAQILVRLIKSGATYRHFPVEVRNRAHGSSKTFTRRNLFSVVQTFLSLVREIWFSKKGNALLKEKPIHEDPICH